MEALELGTFNFKDLVGFTSLFIGQSLSGKSFLMKDILFHLKDYIPNIIVISPTERQNKGFSDIVPTECIIKDVSREKLINKISKVFSRQESISAMYRVVNDLNILREIAKVLEVDTSGNIENLEKLLHKCENNRREIINEKCEIDQVVQVEKTEEQKRKIQTKLIKAFKSAISEASEHVDTNHDPRSKEQVDICRNLHINPHLILILDDCAAIMDTQMQKLEIIKKLFFQGRHGNLTLFITIQNNNKLVPDLRTQAHFLFFTEGSAVEGYAQANKGSIDNKSAKEVSQKLTQYKSDFVKSVFARATNKFYYVKAEPHFDFQFGSQALKDYCKLVRKPSK